MKTLKRIIVGALGAIGFVLACNDYQPNLDFWGIVCLVSAIGLGLYWKPELDNEDNPII